MEVLFHVTEQENLPSILEHGLVPKIGKNSATIGEDTPRIFLTDLESIPYWVILLGVQHPIIFSVIVNEYPEWFNYTYYKEYFTCKSIPVNRLSIVQNVDIKEIDTAMKKLCESYVDWVCTYCVRLLYYYEKGTPLEQVYDKRIDVQFNIMERLDYTCKTQQEWRDYLSSVGESGRYTFFDDFAVKSKPPRIPIWQKLLTYPNDELMHTRELIVEFIRSKFPNCIGMCTGGWTG